VNIIGVFEIDLKISIIVPVSKADLIPEVCERKSLHSWSNTHDIFAGNWVFL